MKNYLKALSMLAIATTFVLMSCEKKNDDLKSTRDLLTAGNWKITGMTIDPGIEFMGITITDIYSQLIESCVKDDLMKFNADGSITDDEGATKCDPSDPQTTTDGTWTLTNDDKTITIMYPDEEPAPATIISINETTLIISSAIDMNLDPDTDAYIATITMTLQ